MPKEAEATAEAGELEASGAAARRDAEALVEPATHLVADAGLNLRQVRAVLPHVLSDVPVAILLVDQRTSEVVYANRAAVEMAGHVHLPVPLNEWGTASALTGLDGRPLSSATSPLARVISGDPVAGKAVRARLPDGWRGAETDGKLGRLLWATGIPLTGAGDEQPMSLLVFLEITVPPGAADDPETQMAALRDRAIIATDLSFTISDPRQEDNPLVWVNPAFTRVTGYQPEEALGLNCRFLQGPATDPATIDALRAGIRNAEPVVVSIVNYRKDGTAFWNQLSVSPVFDGDGNLVSYVGVQADVTERVRVDTEREAALQAERAARQETERARARVALLAEATTRLSSTLRTTESLERLADLVVPNLADSVVIHMLEDGDGSASRLVLRHRHGQEELLARYARLLDSAADGGAGLPGLLTGGGAVMVEELTPSDLAALPNDELRSLVDRLGFYSLISVPLVARQHRILGTMHLMAGHSGRRFSSEDLGVAADLARRAGISIDNARLYEQEHRVAETLQRSLLPAIPKVRGVTVSAQYLPANSVAEVGGDFYELLPLPDGSVGVAVGDVVGHDLSAAAAMGHLRGLLRACAWDDAANGSCADPERVLDRVDRLVQGLDVVPLATLVYARASLAEGGWALTCANAGHPPPVLRLPDGKVEVLREATGMILGVSAGTVRAPQTRLIPFGSTLVAYTDGLVERRGLDIEDGIGHLVELLSGADPSDLDRLVDDVVTTLGADRDDDVAVIAVRLDERS